MRVKCDTVAPLRQALTDVSFLSQFGGLPARVVEYTVSGSEEPSYRLLTTQLDPPQAAGTEFAALYHERWEIESAYNEIRTYLLGNRPILRGKTLALVRQETVGLMLAHYTGRHSLHEVAQAVAEDPARLSFIHTVRMIRRRI